MENRELSKKRIVFMGTPEYADVILKRLMVEADFEVAAVYTQPDKPVGRKKVMTPPPVKVTAEEAEVPVHQPLSLKEEQLKRRKCLCTNPSR